MLKFGFSNWWNVTTDGEMAREIARTAESYPLMKKYKGWDIRFEIIDGDIHRMFLLYGDGDIYEFRVGDTSEDYEFHFGHHDSDGCLAHAEKAIDSVESIMPMKSQRTEPLSLTNNYTQDLPLGALVRHKQSGNCAKIVAHNENHVTIEYIDGKKAKANLGYFDVESIEAFAQKLKRRLDKKETIKVKAKKHPKHPFATTSSPMKYGVIESVNLSRMTVTVLTSRGFTEFWLEAIELIN